MTQMGHFRVIWMAKDLCYTPRYDTSNPDQGVIGLQPGRNQRPGIAGSGRL